MKKELCAVLTDTVSPGFYFPLWHSYYARNFGPNNLYILTYGQEPAAFAAYPLGGVWSLRIYGNEQRIVAISSLLKLLLERYRYVIRADTDEFLIPDVRNHASLQAYLESLDRPYVTAEGMDVIHEPNEPPLDLQRPLLIDQRRFAYRYDALSKTCVAGMGMHWSPGFHFASVFPEFNQLYLLHMKRADVTIQSEIGAAVAEKAPGEPNQPYYLTPEDRIRQYNRAICALPRGRGWDHLDTPRYSSEFLKKVRFTTNYGGVYHGGAFRPEQTLLELPQDFAGVL